MSAWRARWWWRGKILLQLPQRYEALPRQHRLSRWSASCGASAADSFAALLRPRPCEGAFLVELGAARTLGGLARLGVRRGKLFLAVNPLSLGKACRRLCLCLFHGEPKLTRGSGCRHLFCPGGDASHLLLGSVAGEAPLLVGADRNLHHPVEELLHDVVHRLLPRRDKTV